MTQYTNPINKKLAKNSKIINHQSQTPIKTTDRTRNGKHENKQNFGILPFDPHHKISNSSSLRKIGLLERKKSRKDISTNFFQRQLIRRKQKYEGQLVDMEEKFQNELGKLQKKLIETMKKQEVFDDQLDNLQELKELLETKNEQMQEITASEIMPYTNVMSFSELNGENDENADKNIEGSSFNEFTYTLQSLGDMKQSIKSGKKSEQILLDQTLQYYFSNR